MAAQLSLAVNIIDVVKHTYDVAQFVYKSVRSAQAEDSERQKIASDLGRELRFLASFQRYFEKAHGAIAYDQKLDEVSHQQSRPGSNVGLTYTSLSQLALAFGGPKCCPAYEAGFLRL